MALPSEEPATAAPGGVHTNANNAWELVGPLYQTNSGGGYMTGRVRDIEGRKALGPAVLDAIQSDDDVFVGPAEEIADIHWRRSRVVLIGDAAHALSPSFGQGANLAIEDAYVLAEELATNDDIGAALDAFVARREPRVAFVQEKTAERIELVNRGANQRDLYAATQLVEAHLSAPI